MLFLEKIREKEDSDITGIIIDTLNGKVDYLYNEWGFEKWRISFIRDYSLEKENLVTREKSNLIFNISMDNSLMSEQYQTKVYLKNKDTFVVIDLRNNQENIIDLPIQRMEVFLL